ncbi:glutamyl-tRNA synthetase [Arboricoccus pini]|uniref:Glutamate--tRNA ligase n=1 Tax=Arboricoccus pini TaxID=1963835 RepID=A0A212RBY0_9PROT|nr:glutamate--tRNA ligase [Arboricoccus pini]SNB69683.1 glutamyl-tRNA synthetase [Arboricoccus pini]
MSVVVRFAPSPTGYLHIGGARTALFNWLYARHTGGRYVLRIEDTDRQRSTEAAVQAILDGLSWLGLDADAPPVFQFARAERHREVAEQLLAKGLAYRCYETPAEAEARRAAQQAQKLPVRYDGKWRDRDPSEAPEGVSPVIRLRAPTEGETVIDDLVQGRVTVRNDQLDDMILLRSDGTPTYMHSVVVDDIDMGITHVIRGDDHLTNTFRQAQLYQAIGAALPRFAHIPLIHGPDGAKLSKRHGALAVTEYREMGLLPEAVRNYLLRLGWGHGDEEIISIDDAIAWFDIKDVGRGPSRLDMGKLENLNAHYLRQRPNAELLDLLDPFLAKAGLEADATGRARLLAGMDGLKQRARTLVDLAAAAAIYLRARPLPLDAKAAGLLTDEARDRLASLAAPLAALPSWDEASLEAVCREAAEAAGIGFGKLAQPLRAAVTGSNVSPGLFEVMRVLGREETLARLADVTAGRNPAALATN